jgi:hypothetical protein
VEALESRWLPSITLSTSAWAPIGPAPVFLGITAAGRINVAAPDPANDNIMYVGADNGGIWKTSNWLDPSPAWTPLTDQPQVLSQSIHEHDLIVTSGAVYAAASGPGGGILHSTDGGVHWDYLANDRFDLAEFNALVVDEPHSTMYAAVQTTVGGGGIAGGVYKSTDGGTTWVDTTAAYHSGSVTDLVEVTENGVPVLYAGFTADTDHNGAASAGVWKSANGGQSWSRLNVGIPIGTNVGTTVRLAVGSKPFERIYAAILDPANVVHRYSSGNGGLNWSKLDDLSTQTNRARHIMLAVDPANVNNVFVNTDDVDSPQPTPLTETVEMSTNGGIGLEDGPAWPLVLKGGSDPAGATFDKDGRFVLCGDNGVYRLNPATSTLEERIGNLNVAQFYSFTPHPTDSQVAYGIGQDFPGIEKYSGTQVWAFQFPNLGGEFGKVKVPADPADQNRAFAFQPNLGSVDVGGGVTKLRTFLRTDDAGQNCLRVPPTRG